MLFMSVRVVVRVVAAHWLGAEAKELKGLGCEF